MYNTKEIVRVAGGTADIETGQLLIIKRCLCSVVFCNYKCLNIRLFQNRAVFYTYVCYQSVWNPACWRWSNTLSCNIHWFSCLSHRNFTVSFSVCVV